MTLTIRRAESACVDCEPRPVVSFYEREEACACCIDLKTLEHRAHGPSSPR